MLFWIGCAVMGLFCALAATAGVTDSGDPKPQPVWLYVLHRTAAGVGLAAFFHAYMYFGLHLEEVPLAFAASAAICCAAVAVSARLGIGRGVLELDESGG